MVTLSGMLTPLKYILLGCIWYPDVAHVLYNLKRLRVDPLV